MFAKSEKSRTASDDWGMLITWSKKKRYKSNHSRIRMVVLYLGIGVCGKPNTRELFKSEKSLIKKLIFFKINNHHPLALCVSQLAPLTPIPNFYFSLFFPLAILLPSSLVCMSRTLVELLRGKKEKLKASQHVALRDIFRL